MFENIIAQNQVINQLKSDIESGKLPPSVLFSGPEYAGKGTAALELARVLGCENETKRGSWNCPCPSCVRHRHLVSPDLLVLGRRRFFEETAASSGAFLRAMENEGGRMLFLRSVRKLLVRFNSVLWEDDPKLGKLKNQIDVLEEELEDIETTQSAENTDLENKSIIEKSAIEKKCEAVAKKAAKLQADGLGELIPIAQIRRAAYWSRLAPLGRHKCIIMENAENMQEGAKNSLLKILEEPPPHLSIILTSSRPNSLLPTMLSRLREYHFVKRNAASEKEVISRIFREPNAEASSIDAYLASFLPVKNDTLYVLGAFFAASVAAETVRESRAKGVATPAVIIDLGKFATRISETGGMGRPAANVKDALQKVISTAEQFEIPGLFARFLRQCSALISAWLRDDSAVSSEKTTATELWRGQLNQAMAENDVYNISPPMALERLFEALKTGMV